MTEITEIQRQYKINGSWNKELPEQKILLNFLKPTSKVLELGGNIGRASIIINHIIDEKEKHLVLETNPYICHKLIKNKKNNNLKFNIFNGGLSKKPILYKHWDSIQTDNYHMFDGYKKANTITLEEINKKYNINFNTIVADCEGAFIQILKDFPTILDKINYIFIEHDWKTHSDYVYYLETMKNKGYNMINSLEKKDIKLPKNWGVAEDEIFHSVWEKKNEYIYI